MAGRKLIAMDLDGTTLRADQSISPAVRQALTDARAAGHITVFATGRADTDMTPLESDLKLVDYVILNNGAKLIRCEDGAVLANEVLNSADAAWLVRQCLKRQQQVYLVSGKNWYINCATAGSEDYRQLTGCEPVYFNSPDQLPLDRIEGMTIVGESGQVCRWLEQLSVPFHAVASEPTCVDILNPGMNKWKGLKTLLSLLSIPAGDVVAVGDYDNDLEMIRHAGCGVAVANARDCLKREADFVLLHSNEQDAVADVINELVLKQNPDLICSTIRKIGGKMKAAVIGDNCIDVYEKTGRKYPTGNVVDTGVNIRKLGIPVSIISTTGSDENGAWMIESLKAQHVDLSHFKIGDGATAVTYMDMDGLDRVHGDYVEGVLEHIVFDEEDIRFAAEHDLVHTALWGKAEDALPEIRKRSKAMISFDYADRLAHELVEKTLPFVDYGFFSYHKERDEWIEGYLKDKVDRGMKIAVATFGEQGSLAYDGEQFYAGGIYPAEVVNTVGAGDSFIAGFLYERMMGAEISKCLDTGARVAARVVSVFNPWED